MRFPALVSILLLGMTMGVMAQDAHSGEAAVTYHWLRSNVPPGGCGCFALQGGGVSGSWNLRRRWALVGEISAEHAGNVLSTGKPLTVTSFLAGTRYRLPQWWRRGSHSPEPFAQLLLGAAHASGGMAGSADSSFAFASRMGGGIDVPLSSRIGVRIIQIDYSLTRFANSTNDHQNNLLLSAGVVFHWSRGK